MNLAHALASLVGVIETQRAAAFRGERLAKEVGDAWNHSPESFMWLLSTQPVRERLAAAAHSVPGLLVEIHAERIHPVIA